MSRRRRLAIHAMVASMLAGAPCGAAIWRWTGLDATSSAWSRPQNWDLLSAPPRDGTATVVFGAIAPSARHDPVADVVWDVAAVELASNESYVVSGATLSLRGGVLLSNPSVFGTQHRISNGFVLLGDSPWSNQSAAAFVATGNVDLGGHVLDLAPGGSGTITLQGAISGVGGLVKRDGGTLRLAGHNTYSGGTTLLWGLLVAQGPNAIPPGAVTLRNGLLDLGTTGNVLGPGPVVLDGLVMGGVLAGSVFVTGSPLRIAALGDWVVYDPDGGMSETMIAGTLDLDSPSGTRVLRIGASTFTSEELSIIAGIVNPASVPGPAPAIRKLGRGHILLSGINTFGRALEIAEGSIVALRPEALGATGPGDPTIVLAGASLELASTSIPSETVRLNGPGLDGIGALNSRGAQNAWAGPVVLDSDATIGADAGGSGLTIGGVVSGAGGLRKVGAGLLSLTAANAYQGATTVAEGMLRAANASGDAIPGDVTVAGGGTLAGDGSVGGAITVAAGGAVEPAAGGAPASSLAAGSATFAAGSTLRLALASNGSNARIDIAGAAQLAGRLELVTVAPYSPEPGHAFTLVRYRSLSGSFTDLTLPALAGGARWILEYRVGELVARVVAPTTGIDDDTPVRTALLPPAPNPFSGRARIPFQLARAAHARIEVLDLEGRIIGIVADQPLGPGRHEVEWAPPPARVANGVYFVRLRVDGVIAAPPRRIARSR